MLEAASADLVSPSAWSAAPDSSAIHKLSRPITPSFDPNRSSTGQFCCDAQRRL